MRHRTHPVSRIERVASVATATGVTVGTVLVVLIVPGQTFLVGMAPPALDDRRVSEHVVYVVPPPATLLPPARQVMRSPARRTSSRRERASVLLADTASLSNSTAPAEPAMRTTSPARAAAGAPAAGAIVGFTRTNPEPIRFDSVLRVESQRLTTGLATGKIKPPPLTQAEIDAKWRAEAFDVAAARGAGTPLRRTMVGGSIPVPLPFGGPSKKQRQRDRAIFAELQTTLALRQKKVDSIVAARHRRADSLTRVSDSLRQRTRPPS
jgi:hypothetical protein